MYYKIRFWIPLGITITLLCGLIYVATHQVLRQSANDPQIAMSEDIGETLSNQGAPAIDTKPIELVTSLSPFVIIYDSSGNVVSSTATLHGKIPQLPKGVLEFAKANNQNRLTWQPESGVREAVVVTYYTNNKGGSGYVLVGRSLRETEQRVSMLLWKVGLGWIVTMVASLLGVLLLVQPPAKKK